MRNIPTGPIKTIAIVGAGKLGTVVARLALQAGYKVYISGSGDPAKIALSIKFITPGAIATTTADAISYADVVILALPLGKFRELPVGLLRGKLVIDAMNYWWEIDGNVPELANPATSSSEMVQAFLVDAHVVKAISHMGYHHLFDEAREATIPGRKAIAIAGNNKNDNASIAEFIDDLGFDPVIIGPLARGKILEPGHELFGANIDSKSLQEIVDSSTAD